MGKVTKFTVEKIRKEPINNAKTKINLKDKYDDGVMDLSMCELQDVPVKEILTYPKMYTLDLSSNHIKLLPVNFNCLTNIIKLDLSKNELQELPSNFGDLVKLKHLDLYRNKLQHLPLSFSKLQNLRWLDLKGNPLVPKIVEVAGPCLDNKQCQNCARNIVNFYVKLEAQIEEEKMMRDKHRQQSLQANEKKKAQKKKKGKSVAEKKVDTETTVQETVRAETQIPEQQPQKECKPPKTGACYYAFWFFWFVGIMLFTIFVFAFGPQLIKDICNVEEYWLKFVEYLPKNIQPTAIALADHVYSVHVYAFTNLVKLLNYLKAT